MRPQADNLDYNTWKAITYISRTEMWERKITAFWWLYEFTNEWVERVARWRTVDIRRYSRQ